MKDEELWNEIMLPVEDLGKFTMASTPIFHNDFWVLYMASVLAIPKDILDEDRHGSYVVAKHNMRVCQNRIDDILSVALGFWFASEENNDKL